MTKYLGAVLAGLAMMVMVAGCATMGKKSDEELIKETMNTVKTALESKNIDLLLTTFSEDFNHPEVGSKAEAKDMMQMGVDAGYADDGECDISNMQITKNDDGTAEVYPIDLSGAPGSVSVGVVLKKEGDAWHVITVNVDGL